MEFYLVFCITTAIIAFFDIFKPAITTLKAKQPNNQLVRNKYLSYTVFMILTLVLAPFMLFIVIIPSMGNKFREHLSTALPE